jgi:hypothetical protein
MNKNTMLLVFAFITLTIISCTAGPNELVGTVAKEGETAGFWLGLWHGIISPITFIISLFKDTISIYEVHNNGGWYNFGFLLGAICIVGSGSGKGSCGKMRKSPKEKEWEEIGVKVEEKVRTGIKSWLDESEHRDKDWEDIGEKIEEKIKRELRKWADS